MRANKALFGCLLCMVCWLFSPMGVAEQGSKTTVTIGMGNFEPYFIADGETGIFTDLINAVFVHLPDYSPHYQFGFSNSALWARYEMGRLDAVSNLFESVTLDACRTDTIFRFRDVAVTSSLAHHTIESVVDLSGLSIVTFEGAKKFFGAEFSAAAQSKNYREVDKPELQARMLMGGRYDVSVGDLFIFLDARQKLRARSTSAEPEVPIVIHDIFPQISSRMGFRDPALCAAFNEGLRQIKASGEYEAIYDRYLKALAN